MGDCLTPGNIILLAAAASIQYAQGRTAEQLEWLSAFFDILADNLALLALGAPSCEDQTDSASDE